MQQGGKPNALERAQLSSVHEASVVRGVPTKAIEIANALLEEGMEEGRAIAIASTSRTIPGRSTSFMSSRPARIGP
ncbi:hypothetical protein J6TS7_29900 [Paenibacillus dendritiformis]|nr:hypothetical protein J6TS7_29900 [Paenibacillus dendritiformis]